VALLWKMICNLGDPMSLRHPVLSDDISGMCEHSAPLLRDNTVLFSVFLFLLLSSLSFFFPSVFHHRLPQYKARRHRQNVRRKVITAHFSRKMAIFIAPLSLFSFPLLFGGGFVVGCRNILRRHRRNVSTAHFSRNKCEPQFSKKNFKKNE